MSKRKNNLDEMQEQKLLKIERNGVWFAFWGLCIAIIIQTIMGKEFSYIIGEWIVFLCLAIYIAISCLKNGIWDRRLKANTKTNIIISLIGGIILGLVYFVSSYINYNKLMGSIATGIFMFISTSVMVFIGLTATLMIYKKRVKKLEEKCETDSVDDNK